MNKGWMYILECADGSYYTGSTNNIELRLSQHQAGRGANHTKKRLPVKLVYFEEFQRVDEAFYREKQVQGWSRKKKEALINSNQQQLPELALAYRDVASRASATKTSTLPEALKTSTLPEATKTNTLPEALEGNIPQLRFPEFKDEWTIENLSSLAENLNNKRIPITSNVREKGDIPYYGATGVIDFVKDFIFDEELLLISEDGANLMDRNYPIAYSISGKTWVNNHAHVLKFQNKSTETLVQKYINSRSIEEYLTGKAQPKLNRKNLDRIQIPLAKNPKEQQKIANCLSSLDNVITAETEKLDLLQDHKKGLLQQLFPAEGETKPKFRFPEFKDDWQNEPLDQIYTFRITNSFSRDKLNYEKGKVKNIHYGDIHTKFSTLFDIEKEHIPFINEDVSIARINSENYCKEGDIVIADASEDLDDIGKSIEIVNLNGEKLLAGLHTFLASRIDEKLVIGFGGYLFKSASIRKQMKKEAQGAKVLGISKTRISSIDIQYPKNPKEQQKIANCLSSADELIEVQTKKIQKLQDHKKGLLQQLFPKVNSLTI